MVWLPGPMKAPQITSHTGLATKSASPRCSRLTTPVASALEQLPSAAEMPGDAVAERPALPMPGAPSDVSARSATTPIRGSPKCEPIPGTAGCAVGRSHFRTVTVRMELTVFPALSVAFTVIVARAR